LASCELSASAAFWHQGHDDPLAFKLKQNYMEATELRVTLTADEMVAVNPLVDVTARFRDENGDYQSTEFHAAVDRLRSEGGGSADIEFSAPALAGTAGTLGQFTIRSRGTVTVAEDGRWDFEGSMHFRDRYDFNLDTPRTAGAQAQTVVGNAMPGRGFEIDSVEVEVHQSQADESADWGAPERELVPASTLPAMKAGGAGSDVRADGQ